MKILVSLLCSPPPHLYNSHVQSSCIDKFRDSYNHPCYAYVVHSNCHSLDHDVNSYPCYVIVDKGFLRLNNMIEMMNGQYAKFELYLQEYHLPHETDLSLSCSRPKKESFFPLESDFIVDTPLIGK